MRMPPDVAAEKRAFLRRQLDRLFGYDFFISYTWSDGRVYAVELFKRLQAAKFDCFLDSAGFLQGDNWKRIGDLALRNTNRLVLVGSPDAHQSAPVERELKTFSSAGKRVFAIEFGDSLTAGRYENSLILPLLDRDAIRQRETEERLTAGPSDETVRELRRTFDGDTTQTRRLRVIQRTAVALVLLTVAAIVAAGVAWTQYLTNVTKAARADAQRAAVDVDSGDFSSAVGHFVRSLKRNPDEPLVTSALMRLAVEHPPVPPQPIGSGKITSVKISADGGLIMLLSDQGDVSLFQGAQPLSTKMTRATAIALAPSGEQAAIATAESVVRMGLPTGSDSGSWPVTGEITALAINDGGQIAAGQNKDDMGNVILLDESNGFWTELGSLPASISNLWLLNSPLLLAANDTTNQWRVWKNDMSIINEGLNDPDTHWISGICFADNGRHCEGTASEDAHATQARHSSLRLFEPVPGSQSDDTDSQNLGSWLKKNILQLSTDRKGDTCLIRLDSDEIMLAGKHSGYQILPGLADSAFSADGTTVVTIRHEGRLEKWSGRDLSPSAKAYAPEGITSLTVNEDASVVVATAPTGALLYTFRSGDHATSKWTPLAGLPETFVSWRATEMDGIQSDDTVPDRTDSGWALTNSKGDTLTFRHLLSADEEEMVRDAEESMMNVISYQVKLSPKSLAKVSADRRVIATSAGAQAVKVWDAETGVERCALRSRFLPSNDQYVVSINLSQDGNRALVGTTSEDMQKKNYQLFETCTCNAVARESTRYPEERFWGLIPDFTAILATSGKEIEIRNSETQQVSARPKPLDGKPNLGTFSPDGQTFMVATREGTFRLWRTDDAMPLCAESVFDPEPHLDEEENKDQDAYRFSVSIEPLTAGVSFPRRLAFHIDNDNTPGTPPPEYRVFDVGLSGDRHDHDKFADLISEAYGIQLSDDGNLSQGPPPSFSDLALRYLAPGFWHHDDFRAVAEWLLRGRFQGRQTPYSSPLEGVGARGPRRR